PAPRGKYRQYTDKQWEDFLKDVTLGFGLLNVSDAAKKAGINPRTARDKLRQFMKNTKEGFPVHRRTREGAKGGRVPILNEEHTKFIIDYFGDKPEACIRDLKRALVWDWRYLTALYIGMLRRSADSLSRELLSSQRDDSRTRLWISESW
ncbi:hypothetical protein BGZ58_005949, partial [Dissophora ornata]